jgi:hypothetical protein
MADIEENPWLVIDEDMLDIIVGNKAGLKVLSHAIDNALEKGETDLTEHEKDISISKIVFTTKEQYRDIIPEYKETIGDKLIAGLFFIWCVVLPIAAIGLLINLLL